MADHFLTKSNIELAQCLEHGDGLALEAYPALFALLSEKAGPEAAKIFAEPLLSRGNDTASPSISWYTDVEGSGQPVSRLDDTAQAAIATELSQQLRAVRRLLDDPDDGPLIAAALHLSDPNDVWSVGGRPVILNWGMLPKEAPKDAAARTAHYERTLGRYLPLAAAPPITASERQAWHSQRNGGQSMTEETPQNSAPKGPDKTVVAAPPPPPSSRVPLSAWLPLVLLLLLAGGVLAWLMVPGSRIFPEIAKDRAITDEATLAAAEGVNRSLEERLATLQDSLDRAVCTDDGSLLMPDGRTIEGLLPPDPNDPEDRAGAIRTAQPDSILPPDPERVHVSEPNGPKDTVTLLAHIEERTAIVLAPTSNGLATGTGFFVGPDLLVTNHHVVAGGTQGIFVTNQALGKLHQAQVLKALGPFQQTGGDFALLRVPGVQQPAFSILEANQTLKLQSVIAAGYPGDLLQTDDQFQSLRAGNAAAVPDLAVTDGTVSTEQSVNSARMIAHSAPISKGNSGGPLIDMCGRVIGVNTFIKQGTARTLNFALAAGDLMRFLAGTDALPTVVTDACAPRIERPAPPATAALQPETGIKKLPPLKKSE